MLDCDFQASTLIAGTTGGSLSREVKRSHSPLIKESIKSQPIDSRIDFIKLYH
jgi:hypothetical protein